MIWRSEVFVPVEGLLLAVRFAHEVTIAGGQSGWISRLGPARRRAQLSTPLLSRPALGQGR
jgi:hypothetical protein